MLDSLALSPEITAIVLLCAPNRLRGACSVLCPWHHNLLSDMLCQPCEIILIETGFLHVVGTILVTHFFIKFLAPCRLNSVTPVAVVDASGFSNAPRMPDLFVFGLMIPLRFVQLYVFWDLGRRCSLGCRR